MDKYKPLPIGVDSFEELITNGYYYVDKTLLIRELLDMKGEVNLFTRPRRFGKTLNLMMLRSFFEIPGRRMNQEKQKQIFGGLAIMEEGTAYTSQMGKYPVIFLTLKSAKQNTWELARTALFAELEQEFDRHRDVLESGKLSPQLAESFGRILGKSRQQGDYQRALAVLSQCLEAAYSQKTVILIDEYDVPLENAYFHGFYDEMIGFLRSLFESGLKTNEALAFAVMTGCLRISKESIFTGMNHMKIVSIRDPRYAEHFGFTQREVDGLLAFYGLTGSRQEVKRWYDGYLFGKTEVYNPWSLINYVERKHYDSQSLAEGYWANTSGNAIVRSLIDRSGPEQKQQMEILIAGGTIEKPVHEDITYGEMGSTMDNLWNFLYFTGYLTKVSERRDDEEKIYVSFRIPNAEVLSIYRSQIQGWFEDKLAEADLQPLFLATLSGDTAVMEEEIGRMLFESISYLDNKEAFYHGFLTGVYRGMKDYLVESNREEGNGRPDLVVRHPSIRREAVLFELKVADSPETFGKKCDEAVSQIRDRRYGEGIAARGYQQIRAYGISFYGKDCCVKEAKEQPGYEEGL